MRSKLIHYLRSAPKARASARQRAMRRGEPELVRTLVAELASRFGVVSDEADDCVRVGILDEHRASVFELLREFAAREQAELASSLATAVPVARLRRRLGATSAPAHVLFLGSSVLEVDFWRTTSDSFLCPRDNLLAKRIPRTPELAHVFRPGAPFSLESLHRSTVDFAPTFDVDLVYTWVNDRDPAWRHLYEAHAPGVSRMGARPALFRNTDELRYSLRSIAYAPWVRRVFIVTNCAAPSWPELASPRVSLVSHEAIIPADGCPTFNSHAIEACLHRIPGLAEHFLYLNDDMLFLNPTRKSDFFLGNGASKSFLEPYGMVLDTLAPGAPDYLLAARNGKRLIEQAFGRSPTQLHEHVPYALNRCVLEELERRFPAEFAATQRSRFRSPSDLSVPSFLYHHYAFQTRAAVRAEISSHYLIKARDWQKRIARARTSPTEKILCVNDSDTPHVDASTWSREVTRLLDELYPAAGEP